MGFGLHGKTPGPGGFNVSEESSMTWFSVPTTQGHNEAEFSDATSASAWLARQPQANAPAMLDRLLSQLLALNVYRQAPRERFKTLEVLRKTLFSVSGECQRRYENKALPLLPAEQAMFDSTRQLWRACRIAYLHCLRACLDGDSSLSTQHGKLVHRALTCLRMEQMHCYLAGAEVDGEFWRELHAVLPAAEQLGVERQLVGDPQLGETSESTPSGQYAMALLLHLARPYSLTRAQFSAIVRWLARWREQAKILSAPDANPRACCIALDLTCAQPLHDNLRVAGSARWLALSPLLRKIRQRLESLAAGESPESLKLGSVLSSEACVALLNELIKHLKFPPQAAFESSRAATTTVASGPENIFRLLGGKGLKDASLLAAAPGSTLSQERLALFGHSARAEEDDQSYAGEPWQFIRREPEELYLLRPAGVSAQRLALKGLLAIRETDGSCTLASLHSLYSRQDGSLCVVASPYPGTPVPLLVEIRGKTGNALVRHPGFLLPAKAEDGVSSVILPLGLPAHALSMRFYEAREKSPLALRLLDLLERGGDIEHWSLSSDQRFGEK